ncbi:hypothetical protein KW790_01925 [Candidatus Parcubacteria bacterium]|nr:hypothetical protein [Candidatus Parcubacteria bacterium]
MLFCPVKLKSVEEPERRRFERLVRPPVAVRVPVKLAAADIVWPFMRPVVSTVEKRLVLEAVVLNMVVVVAFVVVLFCPVNDRRVDEPESKRLESDVSPLVTVNVPVKFAADEIVWLFIRPEVI